MGTDIGYLVADYDTQTGQVGKIRRSYVYIEPAVGAAVKRCDHLGQVTCVLTVSADLAVRVEQYFDPSEGE